RSAGAIAGRHRGRRDAAPARAVGGVPEHRRARHACAGRHDRRTDRVRRGRRRSHRPRGGGRLMSATTAPPRRGLLTRYRQGFTFWSLMPVLAIVLFVGLLIYPLVRMFVESLTGDDADVLGVYAELFSKAYYYESLINSFLIGIVVTLTAGVIGVTLAYLVFRF